MNKFTLPFLLTSFASLSAPHAVNANTAEPSTYLGANYGGYKSRGGEFEEDNDFVQGILGFQLLPVLGIEFDYTDFGQAQNRISSVEIDGYGASVVGRIPLSEDFSLFAKGGRFYWDAEVQAFGVKDSFEGDEPYYGAGMTFSISDAVDFNLEYNRYEVELKSSQIDNRLSDEDSDIDTLKAGVRFKF
ncbi:OmpA domain protein transmembrane region-containing protein, putative [gamma proteobacterium HTCC5015]|nr:OmpA domain protein transmembrane region-containing protein, putative [gamma proteobacterium HTCC5015]